MVRAGSAVDELMEQLFPHLSEGDILIDGGIPIMRTQPACGIGRKKGFRFVELEFRWRGRSAERRVYHARRI